MHSISPTENMPSFVTSARDEKIDTTPVIMQLYMYTA